MPRHSAFLVIERFVAAVTRGVRIFVIFRDSFDDVGDILQGGGTGHLDLKMIQNG